MTELIAAIIAAGGWLALTAALMLALVALQQGYFLLRIAKRRQQVLLGGLPIGATLSNGGHHFVAAKTRQEADISDWHTAR